MLNIIVSSKVTLFRFGNTDIEYFNEIFIGVNRLQLPIFDISDSKEDILSSIVKQSHSFVAVRKCGNKLNKMGIIFIIPRGHICLIKHIQDESMQIGLLKKLNEISEWKKATPEEWASTPEQNRRIKVKQKPGKKPHEIKLIKRGKHDIITSEEKTISEDIIDAACKFCFDRLNAVRIETFISAYDKLSAKLMTQSGFQKDGVLRKYIYMDNIYHDMQLMSKIRP